MSDRGKLIPVSEVKIGDMLDLAGDPIADPASSNVALEFELALVVEVERETPDCTLIGLEGLGAYGFPPGHQVWLAGHDDLN